MASLSTKEEDIQKMLAAQVHIGTRNMNHDMKEYTWRRRNDGVHILNINRTYEKINLAARIIVAKTNATPKMMDCFAAELTDVRSDGFAVNVARKAHDSCCHLGCILTLCILPKRQQESCGQAWTSSTTRAGG